MSKLSIIGIVIIIAVICIFCSRRFSRLRGDGNVITENRPCGSFTKLKLNGVFKTIITQDGGSESVKVETDQNLQKTIVIKNEGETLEIWTHSGFNFEDSRRMIVYVNVKNINSIINNCVGRVESQGTIKAPELYLKCDGVGATEFNIETDKLTAVLDAVGKTTLSGSAAQADINNKSVGKLDAAGLKTGTLNIKNSAVGAVEVYATKEISIDHNGVGALRYGGGAVVKDLRDNGVGKVSKAD